MSRQYLIPGEGWLDTDETGKQFNVPGVGFVDDRQGISTDTLVGAQTLFGVTQSGSLGEQNSFAGTQTLGGVTQGGALFQGDVLVGSQTLFRISQSGVLGETNSIAGAQTLFGVAQVGTLGESNFIAGAQTLLGITQTGQLIEGDAFQGSQTLFGVSQVGALSLSPAAQVSELFVATLVGDSSAAQARVSEMFVATLVGAAPASGAVIPELFVSSLVYRAPCATQRCDLWKITRRDGVVFTFTSLDRDFVFGTLTYRACGSLQDSASESSADIGSVGSVTLTGLISDASLTDADLYAGLFDDAYVECWVADWGDSPDPATPFRVAAGWMGQVTREQASYTAEVLGPGARLQQTSLVEFFQPGCRWIFGQLDSNGIGCPVDAEALMLRDVQVTGAKQRYAVFFDHGAPGGTSIWNGGTLRWTYGVNAGVECQVDTVDFTGQVLSLWDLAPFPPQVGDMFDLLPGCPKTKTACQTYDVYVSFGGFPDVPGPDSLQQNADALFSG